jgi:hypothetical protein
MEIPEARFVARTAKPCEIDGSTGIGHPFIYQGSYVKYNMQILKGNRNYNISAEYHLEELVNDNEVGNINCGDSRSLRTAPTLLPWSLLP